MRVRLITAMMLLPLLALPVASVSAKTCKKLPCASPPPPPPGQGHGPTFIPTERYQQMLADYRARVEALRANGRLSDQDYAAATRIYNSKVKQANLTANTPMMHTP